MNGTAGEPIRLLIADDHPVVRDGLTGMFAADPDFFVAGEAADGSQALRVAEAVRRAYCSGAPDGERSLTATAWAIRGTVP